MNCAMVAFLITASPSSQFLLKQAGPENPSLCRHSAHHEFHGPPSCSFLITVSYALIAPPSHGFSLAAADDALCC